MLIKGHHAGYSVYFMLYTGVNFEIHDAVNQEMDIILYRAH